MPRCAGAAALLVPAAVGVGVLLPTQGGVNVALGNHLGSGLLSGCVNLVVGLGVVLALRVAELARQRRPPTAVLQYVTHRHADGSTHQTPVKAGLLVGVGAMGAVIVLSTVLLIANLGFSLFFVTNVSASMVTSVVVDHTGFMGTTQKRVGLWSAVGLAMTVAGALLFTSSGYTSAPMPALTPLAIGPGA